MAAILHPRCAVTRHGWLNQLCRCVGERLGGRHRGDHGMVASTRSFFTSTPLFPFSRSARMPPRHKGSYRFGGHVKAKAGFFGPRGSGQERQPASKAVESP
jgi:hypothetical protein